MKRFACFLVALLTAIVCLPLGGCGEKKITVALAAMPASLDPQVASGGAGDTVFSYLFSGLITLDENGLPTGDCAENFYLSADGLKLTFVLKPQLRWTNGKALTSADFAFAIKRLLMPQTGSQYAAQLMSIAGAQAYSEGKAGDVSGISCPDESTLELTLERQDDGLLYAFAAPYLSPCNEEYFNSTDGAYGITTSKTLANGRYTVKSRGESAITLKRKDSASERLPDEISFVLTSSLTEAQSKKLLEGSAAIYTEAELKNTGAAEKKVGTACWALLLAGGESVAADPRFAELIALGGLGDIQRASGIAQLLPSGAADAYMTDKPTARGSDFGLAKSYISQICGEKKLTSMPKLVMAVPDTLEARALTDELVSAWQKNIGLFVTREFVSAATVRSMYKNGSCDMAVLPLEYGGSVAGYYSELASLLGDAEVSEKLGGLSGLSVSAYCYAAEMLLYAGERVFPFANTYTRVYYDDSRMYYEPRFGTLELK